MQTHISTTPFGRRAYTLAMVAGESFAKECAAGIVAHKWEVFRAVCEGRAAIGVSERAISVLNALLTFHPETVLTGDGDLVVFPSNQQLSLRAHGMAPSTLRRHLAVLVDRGLVVRRDSPNGKRYQRKGGEGEDARAFGFDLKPLVARAAEFEGFAKAVREERRAVALLRERITVARRDVVKMIATGVEEGVAGDWGQMQSVYASIIGRLPRQADSVVLSGIAEEIGLLRNEAVILLEEHVKSKNMTANESCFEQHIQNSKPEPSFESEPVFRSEKGEKPEPKPKDDSPPRKPIPLPMVLDACPDVVDYAKSGVQRWTDLVTAADVARVALGISPSAYEDAQNVMGRSECAVVVSAILQKGSAVNNAGAYLRSLTSKARAGTFSSSPMVMALLKMRHLERAKTPRTRIDALASTRPPVVGENPDNPLPFTPPQPTNQRLSKRW